MREASPIFIVGHPRSGTTLMRSLLCAHSQIAIAPEMHFFLLVERYSDRNLDDKKDFDIFWNDFVSLSRFKSLDLDPLAFRSKLALSKASTFKQIFSELMSLYASQRQKSRWGEKSPGNECFLPKLLSWYPDSRILFLQRDPRAIAASLKSVPWDNNTVATHALTWRKSNLILEKWLSSPQVLRVRYESLVSNPSKVLRQVCQFVGEGFEETMISDRAHSLDGLVTSSWQAGEYKKAMGPINNSNIHKWKHILTPFEIGIMESLCQDTLTTFKYQVFRSSSVFLRGLYRFIGYLIWSCDNLFRRTTKHRLALEYYFNRR